MKACTSPWQILGTEHRPVRSWDWKSHIALGCTSQPVLSDENKVACFVPRHLLALARATVIHL